MIPYKKFKFAILSEWYLPNQKSKFIHDANKVKDIIFNVDPYRKHKNIISIDNIFTAVPHKTSSLFDTSYNSLGIERYLISKNEWEVNNACRDNYYNSIIILCNSSKYGGGGIYGKFACVPSDNDQLHYLVVHELGHSVAGLADEYYDSSVTYNLDERYLPWEPNISTIDDIKWLNLINSDTPVPTPWNDAVFNSSRNKIIELYKNEVGMFQGARYNSKNLYRSQIDCIMFSKNNLRYCKVCSLAIEKVLTFSI